MICPRPRYCAGRCAKVLRGLAAMMALSSVSGSHAEVIEVRLRFAWGTGAQAPQKWVGKISAPGATLSSLQPLGVEADEAAALRLEGDAIIVSPLVRRAFDGCDVTIRGDDALPAIVELRSGDAPEFKRIEIPLRDVAAEEFRAPLDKLGGYLLVHRTPGDRLRVALQRDSLVLEPKEKLKLSVSPDAKLAAGDVTIDARLFRVGGDEVLWESSQQFTPSNPQPIELEIETPADEAAYRLELAAHLPRTLATRFVPWEQSRPLAARNVEFIVIDPSRRLPRLADKWEVVETINPATSHWWQRFPQWTRIDRLPGLAAPRPFGNVSPEGPKEPGSSFVSLPPPRISADPCWQGYQLSVQAVGQPHVVEIEMPLDSSQHLGVSIIEPDAAGRVLTFGRDCGAFGNDRFTLATEAGAAGTHRMSFWPRTSSPVLLLTNRSSSAAARYGRIRVLRRLTDPAPADIVAAGEQTSAPAGPAKAGPKRVVAAYISRPRLVDVLGDAEQLDADSGLSVDGWSTFLAAAQRLAQTLHAEGYNAAIVSIAAEGTSLTPLTDFGGSPRYDTGLLSSTAADPLRKDLLEALLRIFDREGLQLITAVELAAPLPALEALRATPGSTGIECVADDGRPWRETLQSDLAAGPVYNILNPQVQEAIRSAVVRLAERYQGHRSFAGVALQLSGQGYGVLPGSAWAMDDDTVGRFAKDAGIELPMEGPDRFQRRSQLLQDPSRHLAAWTSWRQRQLTEFYAGLVAGLQEGQTQRRLVLCIEDLFNGPDAAQRVRQAANGRFDLTAAAAELGVDLAGLAAAPGITVLRPRRLGPDDFLPASAFDLQINAAPELDQALASAPSSGEMFYYPASRLRLPSFDSVSPYGADKTYLALSSSALPVGDAARRPLASSLAARDFFFVAHGAETLPLAANDAAVRARRIFQNLPVDHGGLRTDRQAPVTMRVYRQDDAVTVLLVNESPWPTPFKLQIEASEPTEWRELDATQPAPEEDSGSPSPHQTWPAGVKAWQDTLPPYGIEARQFTNRNVRVGALTVTVSDAPSELLAKRITEVEQRMQRLDIERSYSELQNPSFELVGPDGNAIGWLPRIGRTGQVRVDKTVRQAGASSLHLVSEDALGVAIQSHRFPAPATGQLVVKLQARLENKAPNAQLYARLEFTAGGTMLHRWGRLVPTPSEDSEWSTCELAVDDLPVNESIRIQFHLAGKGEAWIDNVQLYDLRFPNAQRLAFAKWLFATKSALDSRQFVECHHLLEDYWPRYLLEHVPPPLPRDTAVAVKPSEPPAAATDAPIDQGSGFGGRIKKLIPPIRR